MSADTLRTLRREVRDQLRVRIDARGLASAPPAERRVRVRDEALDLLRQRGALLPQRELNRIVNEVSDDVVGFGPIESLLKDPTVTEVMVNGPDDVFVEREGRIERVRDRLFEGEEPVVHLIERIVGPLGLRVDHASPWVDARLPDGSRVHAIVPPLSLRGPTLTIRKFSLGADHTRRAGPNGIGRPPHDAVPAVVRTRTSQSRRDQRRRGQWQDDDARRPRGRDPSRRAGDHDRGRRGAPAREPARRRAGGPAGERRGQGRGVRPRSRAQRAADAPRPDHRRRGPRRRGARHAAGDEHGPRGLPVHGARELGAARPVAPRDDGDDVRRRSAGRACSAAGRRRRSM